jgi:hypothetical protein
MNIDAPSLSSMLLSSKRGKCRLCSQSLRRSFVDLGMSPLCESILPPSQLDEMEPYYPLHAFVCDHCFLVQLNQYVTPQSIFREYAYFSSYSSTWVDHARSYCGMITERLGLSRESLVIELASNDGYLLQHFAPLGIPVLGIEPAANVAAVAIDKGIPTLVEFFGTTLAERLAADGKQADLIIGNNVLAQVPDLNDFVAGMALLLKRDGMITLEFPHLQRLIEGNQFDTIYHEHFSYFSLTAIAAVAARHRLKLVDVEELPTHGGSLRVYLVRSESGYEVEPTVKHLALREQRLGYRTAAAYEAFGGQVQKTKRKLLSALVEIKERGHRIVGYGAPGKGNTLLNYCGIGTDFLDFTVDRNPHKHGRFTPGMHIPILPVEAIDAAKPDYVFILPWNLRHEIMQQMSYIGRWGGKFIVPIPEPAIIDPKERQS